MAGTAGPTSILAESPKRGRPAPKFGQSPERAAFERWDAELNAIANAAVIVWEERNPDVWRLLELVKTKGIPVHVTGRSKRR
jgi:hypothetical protein